MSHSPRALQAPVTDPGLMRYFPPISTMRLGCVRWVWPQGEGATLQGALMRSKTTPESTEGGAQNLARVEARNWEELGSRMRSGVSPAPPPQATPVAPLLAEIQALCDRIRPDVLAPPVDFGPDLPITWLDLLFQTPKSLRAACAQEWPETKMSTPKRPAHLASAMGSPHGMT